jgi:hypothetical protein
MSRRGVDGARTRAPVNRRHRLSVVLLTCVVVVLVGCGGSRSSGAANTGEAHLVAVANATCRERREEMRATGATFEARMKMEFASLRALISADRKLPRVGTLISDLAARRRLLREMRKIHRKEGDVTNAFSLLDESYRLEVKIQADLKALGLTSCIGPPPRKPIEG